jgi:GH18 family chitinase
LAEVRSALGSQIISAAVPGLPRDMLAFTNITVPQIKSSLDFLNIMTYDMVNRRDNATMHHTGVELSLQSINAYEKNGLAAQDMNLGFAFYIRWFRTDPQGGCDKNPIGCKTTLMEDPVTGADLGQAGAFAWHDRVPEHFFLSYQRAMAHGKYDSEHGGHYYWDAEENMFWSWDTPDCIAKKFPLIVKKKGLGGVFAWGLGEDANDFTHLKALTAGVKTNWGEHRGEIPYSKFTSLLNLFMEEEL